MSLIKKHTATAAAGGAEGTGAFMTSVLILWRGFMPGLEMAVDEAGDVQ